MYLCKLIIIAPYNIANNSPYSISAAALIEALSILKEQKLLETLRKRLDLEYKVKQIISLLELNPNSIERD